MLPPPASPLHNHALEAVVIGASAGGVEALLNVLSGLPPSYALSVIVVLHMPQERSSVLSDVLRRRLALPAVDAEDKQPVQAGTVYIAPSGYHLLVEAGRTFALNCDEPVLYSRPSIDVLMESAADVWGRSLAGILLTGANEDGAAGLALIKQAGGLTIVQDPADAHASTMPLAAIARHQPDYVLPLIEIQKLLPRLETCHEPRH